MVVLDLEDDKLNAEAKKPDRKNNRNGDISGLQLDGLELERVINSLLKILQKAWTCLERLTFQMFDAKRVEFLFFLFSL